MASSILLHKKASVFNDRYLLHVAVYVFFLKPAIVEDISMLDIFFNLIRFGLSILFILRLTVKSSGKLGTFTLYPIVLFFIALFSTLVHGGAIKLALLHFVPVLGMLSYLSLNKKNSYKEIFVLFDVLSFLVMLNLLFILLFPDGLWIREEASASVWLLGQKQDFAVSFLPTLIIGSLCVSYSPKYTKRFIAVLSAMLFTFLFVKPLGLMIVCFFFMLLLLFKKTIRKVINGNRIWYFCIGVLCCVILFTYCYTEMDVLQSFLANISHSGLGKDKTIMIRTEMWKNAFEIGLRNILIGIGKLNENMWKAVTGLSYYHTIMHNLYLDLFMTGGIISVAIFFRWNKKVLEKLRGEYNNQGKYILVSGLFAIYILMMTESPWHPILFSVFSFAYYFEWIQKSGSINNENDKSNNPQI